MTQQNKTSARLLLGDERLVSEPYALMSLSTYQRMCAYVDLVKTEINGLGSVKRNKNAFFVSDIRILKQWTGGNVHVEFDDADFNRLVRETVETGGTPNFSFQWHSHVWGPPDYSREDVNTVRKYMDEYMISFVTNKYRDYRCRLDIFRPVGISLEIPLYVIIPAIANDIVARCQADISQKVFKDSLRFLKRRVKPGDVDSVGSIIVPAEQLRVKSILNERGLNTLDEDLFDSCAEISSIKDSEEAVAETSFEEDDFTEFLGKEDDCFSLNGIGGIAGGDDELSLDNAEGTRDESEENDEFPLDLIIEDMDDDDKYLLAEEVEDDLDEKSDPDFLDLLKQDEFDDKILFEDAVLEIETNKKKKNDKKHWL